MEKVFANGTAKISLHDGPGEPAFEVIDITEGSPSSFRLGRGKRGALVIDKRAEPNQILWEAVKLQHYVRDAWLTSFTKPADFEVESEEVRPGCWEITKVTLSEATAQEPANTLLLSLVGRTLNLMDVEWESLQAVGGELTAYVALING